MIRRARVVLGALGLTVVLGVGLVGPASAVSITPIKPVDPTTPTGPVKPPPAAPKGPYVPFKGLSPKQIKDKAVRNARAAKSVHVQGVILGQNERLTVDGTFSKTSGRLRYASNLQGSVTFLRIGAKTYMSGDQKFLLSANNGGENDLTPNEAAQLADSWWLLTGNSQALRDLRLNLTAATWIDGLAAYKVAQRVAGKKIAGKQTVGRYEPGAAGGVLYVAASGTAYPLGAEAADTSVVLTYSRWNAAVSLTAPATVGSLVF
jgi:hypothetical protein